MEITRIALRFSRTLAEGTRLITNNPMEIHAAIKGLELLRQPCKVTLYSDSQYVVFCVPPC
jgi:ribonuclease HI